MMDLGFLILLASAFVLVVSAVGSSENLFRLGIALAVLGYALTGKVPLR